LLFSDQQQSAPQVRQSTFNVQVNDTIPLTGVTEIEVTNASHFSADTFRLKAAINGLPSNLGLNYWDGSAGDNVEIFAGFKDLATGAAQSTSLIYGQVDEIDVDLVTQTITLEGRDLSAQFLDTKPDAAGLTPQSYQDQTASQIVQTLAKAHGLQAQVTPTTNKVGAYYELYYNQLTHAQSEWDLLALLAQQENYDMWVQGKTLYFLPPVPLTTDPYILRWNAGGQGGYSANFEDAHLHRSETLGKDVIVRVISWNQAQETKITATAKRVQANKNQRAGGAAQTYTFYPPNLNQAQATQYANAKAEEITRHERIISGSLPGDNLLTHRSLMKLVGTGTQWDQVYFVDTVTRHISFEHGYRMEFRAKNHSTQSTE
jgi:phage protein D